MYHAMGQPVNSPVIWAIRHSQALGGMERKWRRIPTTTATGDSSDGKIYSSHAPSTRRQADVKYDRPSANVPPILIINLLGIGLSRIWRIRNEMRSAVVASEIEQGGAG